MLLPIYSSDRPLRGYLYWIGLKFKLLPIFDHLSRWPYVIHMFNPLLIQYRRYDRGSLQHGDKAPTDQWSLNWSLTSAIQMLKHLPVPIYYRRPDRWSLQYSDKAPTDLWSLN